MTLYMLDMLSCHQRNILFLLFDCDLENSIEYFLLRSHILTLVYNHYTSLHATLRVDYYSFLYYFLVLTN